MKDCYLHGLLFLIPQQVVESGEGGLHSTSKQFPKVKEGRSQSQSGLYSDMVMDLDLPVRRKKGRTDGFTLGVTQGPIPHLINVETRKFFVCHVVDITSRNRIMITLVLHLVSEADGQVSRFLLQEQLVNFNFRVCTFPHLGTSNSL